jgi:hypothetical protein
VVGVELLRSAFEILSWYLHWRRVPWFAVVVAAIAMANLLAYQSHHAGISLFAASISWGIAVYVAASHYAELGRWPETRLEKRLAKEQMEGWLASLSPREQARINRLGEALYLLGSAGGIPAGQALAAFKALSDGMCSAQKPSQ